MTKRLEGLSAESRQELLEDLRNYCEGMPERSGGRAMLEGVLKQFK